ncbi:hypothetical protein [Puniceibacterium confluentis]|uniref:hypothetical protein n=1 Tax=Puniceibacterium confluentis TaxID=1958944 RepID=UPI0011B74579|nr:hypothetical protein [Puniceibacterium confluentis]
MSLFEPSPTLIALIFVKRFVFPELLLLLALIRCFTARGPSRGLAVVTALACGAVIVTTFAPALGLTAQGWYGPAARALAHGQGLSALVGLSALFLASAWLPGRRLAALDWLCSALILGLLGLWLATMY